MQFFIHATSLHSFKYISWGGGGNPSKSLGFDHVNVGTVFNVVIMYLIDVVGFNSSIGTSILIHFSCCYWNGILSQVSCQEVNAKV